MASTRSNLRAALLGLALALQPAPRAVALSDESLDPPPSTLAPTPVAAKPAPHPVRTVQLMLTLAWEGRDLAAPNLQALQSFRNQFQSIQITHLVSPAYFTKPAAEQDAVRAAIRSVMRPKDQIGLLLGNWQSLAVAAGVIFRNSPTFWGSEMKAIDCQNDCGLEVPLNIYPADELDKLLRTSLTILEKQGFSRPRAMAVEGWVASPEILEAAYRAGIRYDMSGVAPEMISTKTRYYPIYQWVKTLWPNVTPHTQPYQLSLSDGPMMEIPQSLGAIDYLNRRDVLAIFKEYAERVHHDPDTVLVFPVVVHQESAFNTLPLLAVSLQEVFAFAQQAEVSITPMHLSALEVPEDDRPPSPAPVSEPAAPAVAPRDMPIAH